MVYSVELYETRLCFVTRDYTSKERVINEPFEDRVDFLGLMLRFYPYSKTVNRVELAMQSSLYDTKTFNIVLHNKDIQDLVIKLLNDRKYIWSMDILDAGLSTRVFTEKMVFRVSGQAGKHFAQAFSLVFDDPFVYRMQDGNSSLPHTLWVERVGLLKKKVIISSSGQLERELAAML